MTTVLTLNGGSSSIRFAFFEAATSRRLLAGKIDRIGGAGTSLMIEPQATGPSAGVPPPPAHGEVVPPGSVVEFLVRWLVSQPLFAAVSAVGHRVVHGMQHAKPERVTPALLAELKRITPYDPEHLPREIELMETVGAQRPDLPQVACFDTAFHRSMPRVATLLPLPRRYAAQGVQRYGFHGLSYTYLLRELERLGEPAHERVILAHLGNGASLAAVRGGRSVDTSMGFTPTSGIMMGTRSGDLDPGVVNFLACTESQDAVGFQNMVTRQSGLLGVSETSADIRDLLVAETTDPRAADAVALFCYDVKKAVGAYAAVLGGVDVLVFAGGIGENSAAVRARICSDLEFLGIELDAARNARGEGLIAADSGRVRVRVIRTDEESVIASLTLGELRRGAQPA